MSNLHDERLASDSDSGLSSTPNLPVTRPWQFLSFPLSSEGRHVQAAHGSTQLALRSPKWVAKSASSQFLDHLPNFSLPPRQSHQVHSLPRRSRRRGTAKASEIKNVGIPACQSSQNKIIPYILYPGFVNAQYRFVMNPLGDYTVHFSDLDMYVSLKNLLSSELTPTRTRTVSSKSQWQDILQIIIPPSVLAAAAAGGGDDPSHEGHITCAICLTDMTPMWTR